MENKKIIQVSASFEQGAALFSWLKKFAQHSDEQFAYWDEFAFTTNSLPECDGILVLNNPSQKINTRCFPENVLAFMMEPGIYSEHPWMFKRLDQYAKVFSPVGASSNTIVSHGFMGWYLQQDHAALSALAVPEKERMLSCIASDLAKLKGHRLRLNFINELKSALPQIDFFGKGTHYIADKIDGLLPYRFSIAMENTAAPYYFTEKIHDCFLAYTVPLYYGCKNIDQFFPSRSFIRIDIEDVPAAIKKIKDAIEKNDWQERLGALQEARELVLNRYQPLAGAAGILRQTQPSQRQMVQLKPVPDSFIKQLRKMLPLKQ
ncbi:glycosyltransferase family 10 domain-containing protein [Ferruginibacter sp.]